MSSNERNILNNKDILNNKNICSFETSKINNNKITNNYKIPNILSFKQIIIEKNKKIEELSKKLNEAENKNIYLKKENINLKKKINVLLSLTNNKYNKSKKFKFIIQETQRFNITCPEQSPRFKKFENFDHYIKRLNNTINKEFNNTDSTLFAQYNINVLKNKFGRNDRVNTINVDNNKNKNKHHLKLYSRNFFNKCKEKMKDNEFNSLMDIVKLSNKKKISNDNTFSKITHHLNNTHPELIVDFKKLFS